MRRKSKDGSNDGGPRLLRKWLQNVRARGSSFFKGSKFAGLRNRLPEKLRKFDFDFQDIHLKDVSEYSGWIRWGLLVLGVFLLAQVTAGVIGLFLRPTFPKPPARTSLNRPSGTPAQDYSAIEKRNIFNVEGTIPEPFEAGQLDCMAQAKATNQPLELLGTIVMSDPNFSVALVQQRGDALRLAVKKDEPFFDGKYVALKIERKRLCFQVRSTQDLEYVEIPEQGGQLAVTGGPNLSTGSGSGGIRPISETKYEVRRDYLDKNLLNLNEVLKTARAVPYTDPATGKFEGFLIQTIDFDSPFAELGLRQGDVLKGVNQINLDNPGKGLEAFQALRNESNIALKIMRGGRETTLEFTVK